MIAGFVTSNKEAIIRLLVRGNDRQEEMVDAVIDTGFNGFLVLPLSLISALALPFAGTTRTTLGDGSEVRMDVFEATVLWDNQERSVVALATQGDALVGMSMLSGSRMTLEVENGGFVTIESLS